MRTPSLFKNISAGSGNGDSSISSPGIGCKTLSVLLRSKAMPIAVVSSWLDMLIGTESLLESFANVVTVYEPVCGLSWTSGAVALVIIATSVEATDDRMSQSLMLYQLRRRLM
jgi:hypothetical protein